MNQDYSIILYHLTEYLQQFPEIRFGQALFNLNINQFADQQVPENKDFLLRNNHHDSNESILKRLNITK